MQPENGLGVPRAAEDSGARIGSRHPGERERSVRRRKRRRVPRIEEAARYPADEDKTTDAREESHAGLAILMIPSLSCILKAMVWEQPF